MNLVNILTSNPCNNSQSLVPPCDFYVITPPSYFPASHYADACDMGLTQLAYNGTLTSVPTNWTGLPTLAAPTGQAINATAINCITNVVNADSNSQWNLGTGSFSLGGFALFLDSWVMLRLGKALVARRRAARPAVTEIGLETGAYRNGVLEQRVVEQYPASRPPLHLAKGAILGVLLGAANFGTVLMACKAAYSSDQVTYSTSVSLGSAMFAATLASVVLHDRYL